MRLKKLPSPIASLVPNHLAGAKNVSRLPEYPDVDFTQGGQWLVDATRSHGVNERGLKLRWNNLLEETLLLIGDFRFHTVSTSGSAQVHKTLSHWQLVSALITLGKHDFFWVYPQNNMIFKLVPTQFRPIISEWERSTKLAVKARSSDSKSMTVYQSARGTGRFVAANNPTGGSQSDSGLAVAAAGSVSFTSDLGLFEEASQYSKSDAEVFDRRLLQSRIFGAPKRFIGTPGRGQGIEREINRSDYSFYPHCQCPKCDAVIAMDPLGCLLKNWEIDPGKPAKYFDTIGRPYRDPTTGECFWHYRDESRPAESAYFACSNCGAELDKDTRLSGWFVDLKSGNSLRDIVSELDTGIPDRQISAGIILSPLIRDSSSNGAAAIISKGMNSPDPQDWQQQEIGIASTTRSGGITIAMIQQAIAVPKPTPDMNMRTVQAWGLDQGTNEHWLCKIKYHIVNNEMGRQPWTRQEIYERSHREVRCLVPINQDDLEFAVQDCVGGVLDNEPGRDWANAIKNNLTGVHLGDQRGRKEMADEVVKNSTVKVGGREIPVILIDHHQIQTYILNLFIEGRVTLPSDINPDDLSEYSITRHLTTSSRDGETGAWTRPNDNKDDLLKAFLFCETWFYCYVHGILPSVALDFAKVAPRNRRR